MRRILLFLLFLALAGQALAQPVTTQPSVNNMTVSQCGSSLPLLGNGAGASSLLCGTISGNTTKFMTGSGTFTNGDVAAFDANGNIVDGGAGSGGGTALADEAAFTQGSTSLTPIGGFYQPNSGTTNLTAGQAGSVRLTPDRFFLTAGGLSTTTGSAWTTSTGSNTTQTILGGFTAMQAALVQLDQTTTLTGGAVTWEGTYDGINWVSLATSQVIDPTSASGATIANPYTFQASTNKAFLLISSGFQQLRMRLSTVISGTGSVTPYFAALPYNALGNGAQKTQIVDGSGNVIASTSNNLNVQCANCSGSGVSTADQASFTAGSSLFAGGGGFFQTTATNNPLTTGQQGMFQVTAQRALFANLRNASGTEIGTSSTPVQVSVANTGANATAILVGGAGTAGSASGGVLTVQGVASMTALLVNPGTIATWGLMSGTTPGTAPTNTLITGCIFNSSAPAPANGQTLPCQVDSSGYLDVDLKSAIPAGSNTIGAVTQASGPWTENLTQIAGSSVSTAATGVQKIGVVGNAGAAFDAVTGAAGPANTLQVGCVFNTSLPSPSSTDIEPLQCDSSARQIMVGAGTAGSAAGGVLTVQGVASMTPLLANPGTAANWGIGATGSSVPANATYVGVNNPSGNLVGYVGDPCQTQAHTFTPINNAASSSTATIVAGTASVKTYVCSMFLFAAAAVNVGLVEGTGTNCSTISAGVLGGTTAGTGENLTANQGFVLNGGGYAVAAAATAADNLCFVYSAAVQVSGVIVTAKQ